MDVGGNRPGRTYHSRLPHLRGCISPRLWAVVAAAAVASSVALGAASAPAMTGGASPFTPDPAGDAVPGPSDGGGEGKFADGGLVFSAMRSAGATWYGPGFYGNRTACGQTL